jgi:hypothetical protein
MAEDNSSQEVDQRQQAEDAAVLDPNELAALDQHAQASEIPANIAAPQESVPDLQNIFGNAATEGLPKIPIDPGPFNPNVPQELSSTPAAQGYNSGSEIPQGPAAQGVVFPKTDVNQFVVPQTQQQSTGTKKVESPEDKRLAKMQDISNARIDALDKMAKGQVTASKQMADTEQSLANELLQRRTDADKQRVEISNHINEQTKKLENSVAEIQASKVDPNRANVLINGSTGQKIVAAIALGLGAYSEAIAGTSTN